MTTDNHSTISRVFIDIETVGLYGSFLVGTCHDATTKELLSYTDVTEFLNKVSQYKQVIAHNVAYEYICLRSYGLAVEAFEWLCSMTLAHCVCKSIKGYTLEELAEQYNLAELKIDHQDFSVYSEELLERNRSDVRITVDLVDRLLKSHSYRFRNSQYKVMYLERLINTWKQRSQLAVTASEFRNFGVHLDLNKLNSLEAEVTEFIETQTQWYFLATYEKEVIQEKPGTKYKRDGKPTAASLKKAKELYLDYDAVTIATDNSVFGDYCPLQRVHLNSATAYNQKLLIASVMPEVIKEGTGNIDSKLLDTLILTTVDDQEDKVINESLPKPARDYYIGYNLDKILTSITTYKKLLSSENLVHSHFNPVGTRTGRFSSSSPNLQNMGGSRSTGYKPLDRLLKQQKYFMTARPGYTMLGADLDKIELVILGHLLRMFGDSKLINAANEGEDIHAVNAAAWGVTRLDAKRGIFSIVYGATKYKLQEILNCSLPEAEDFMNKVSKGMPAIDKAKAFYVDCCRRFGGVWDLAGNWYDYPFINSNDLKLRSRCERQLFNAVIQGLCASLVSILTVEIHKIAKEHQGSLVAVIHDEFLVEVPNEQADLCLERLQLLTKDRYDFAFLLGSKVNADWVKGDSWYTIKG